MHISGKLLLTLAVAAPAALLSQAPTAPVDTTNRIVDRVFDAFRGSDRPGCALGVSRNGQVIYEHGYGMANLETGTPINPSSIFHVASVSKQFTAMAIMLLARDGALSIDDNIRKHLPEIPDYGTPITVRHLITHTSGLRDQWDLLALARGRFEENRITEADVMQIVPRQKALNFTPGTEYVYSNTGYTLLAVIVKRVSGKTLRAYADEKIFKPLGMTNTHFHDDYTMLVPGRTSAYSPVASGWRVSIPNFDVYGATSLFTTVGDLLKWEANFDKPVVGDKNLFDQMQTPARLSNGDSITYGLGVVMDRFRGVRQVSHNGADAGYRSYVGRFPDHGLAIAVACNAATANTTLLARGVASAYLAGALAAVPPAVANPDPVAIDQATLQKRVGAYLHPVTKTVAVISLREGKLTVGPNAPRVLIPAADNRFRVTGTPTEFTFIDGDRPRFEERATSGGRANVFERQPPATTTAAALGAYAGDYYSEELDASYRVTANDSTISIATGTSNPLTARPVFQDGFLGAGYTILFTRTKSQVTGFEVTNARMRGVKFARVASRK